MNWYRVKLWRSDIYNKTMLASLLKFIRFYNHRSFRIMNKTVDEIIRGVRDEKDRILNCINETDFVWRTLSGIQQETKFETRRLESLLGEMVKEGEILRTVSSKDGVVLYTTPEHYQSKMPFIKRFLDSSTGSVSA
jgi:hypothetical protein